MGINGVIFYDENEFDETASGSYDGLELEDYELEAPEKQEMPSSLQRMLSEYTNFPLLDGEEERKLLEEYQLTHDNKIKEKLVCCNLRLVISKAFKTKLYVGRQIDPQDIINDGVIGLITAIDRFDPSKGCRLSTYAVNWISQSIGKGCKDYLTGNMVSLPDTAAYNLKKIKKYIENFETNEHRTPSIDEIAKGTGLRRKQVSDLFVYVGGISSLEFRFDKDENTELQSLIGEDDGDDPTFKAVADMELSARMINLEKVLTVKEYTFAVNRYGLYGAREHSVEELAQQNGITKERVRQILKSATKKLSEAEEFGTLASYLN